MPANQLFTDWVSGDLITAAKLNNMKNNLLAGRGAGADMNATSTSVPNSTTTSLSFNRELYDTDTFFAPTSTNFTVPTGMAGRYLISGFVQFGLSATGATRLASIFVNGVTIANAHAPVSATNSYCTISKIITLADADVVTLRALQDSGAAMNVIGSLDLLKIG